MQIGCSQLHSALCLGRQSRQEHITLCGRAATYTQHTHTPSGLPIWAHHADHAAKASDGAGHLDSDGPSCSAGLQCSGALAGIEGCMCCWCLQREGGA